MKAIIFPVRLSLQLWGYDLTVYNCESWTIRKTECQRIDAFELWYWRRLLRSKISLDSREIKPVNLKGNQPWILVGRTDAKAETPNFWSSEVKSWLIGNVPDAGQDWGKKEKRHQRMRWMDDITDAMDMNLGKLWEMLRDREAWHDTVDGVTKSWTQLSNWTITMIS